MSICCVIWPTTCLSESYAGGTLNGVSITNGYDVFTRRTNNVTVSGGSALTSFSSGYDAASRLAVVSDGTDSASYGYLANSPLVSNIVFKQNSATRMTTTDSYDLMNRLEAVAAAPSADSGVDFTYGYNNVNQRVSAADIQGNYWSYQYDGLGQVTNGAKYFWDGTPVAGQQFGYGLDTLGNRTWTRAGGDASGANLRLASYTNNLLNQIVSRDVPGYVDVMGLDAGDQHGEGERDQRLSEVGVFPGADGDEQHAGGAMDGDQRERAGADGGERARVHRADAGELRI